MNRVIFLILSIKGSMASYDVYREIRSMKGFRHIDSRTVFRRIQALQKEEWILEKGTRPAKPGWDSVLYGLSLRGQVTLSFDKISIDHFLATATEEQLLRLIAALE